MESVNIESYKYDGQQTNNKLVMYTHTNKFLEELVTKLFTTQTISSNILKTF